MDLDLVSHRQTAVSNSVTVDHTQSIRSWLLEKKVEPLTSARSIGAVLDNLDTVASSLAPYGDVSYVLDLKNKPAQKGKPLQLLTTIKLANAVAREPYKLGIYTGTDLNGANFNGTWSNKLGLGDVTTVSGTVQPSPYGLGAGSAAIDVPVPLPSISSSHLGAKVFFLSQECPWASYSLESHGVAAFLTLPSKCVKAKFGVEATARQIHSLADAASDSVRSAAANPATKVSAIAQVSACGFTLEAEQAGKPGDSTFTKLLASTRLSKEVLPPISVSLDANAGYILGKSSILDQFLIGGPGSVYGFKLNSIGPKHGQDFVGAQSFYQGALTVSSWLPWAPNSPLRIVSTLNGAAAQENSSTSIQQNLNNLASLSPSLAAATGLSYRTPAGSFDLLYLHPLHAAPTDILRTGFYLGVNLNYA